MANPIAPAENEKENENERERDKICNYATTSSTKNYHCHRFTRADKRELLASNLRDCCCQDGSLNGFWCPSVSILSRLARCVVARWALRVVIQRAMLITGELAGALKTRERAERARDVSSAMLLLLFAFLPACSAHLDELICIQFGARQSRRISSERAERARKC